MTLTKVLDQIQIIIAAIVLTIVIGGVQARTRIPGAYGLPLPWITVYPCELRICLFPSGNRDWTSFGLDVLFYTFVGYGLLLIYTKTSATKTMGDDESTSREETGGRS